MVIKQETMRTVDVNLTNGVGATFKEAVDATYHDGALLVELVDGGNVLYAPGAWTMAGISPPRTERVVL